MEADAVLSTFAGIAACAQFVHGQCQCLVGFLADGTERDGAGYKVFHNVFHRFYFFNVDGIAFESEEVTQENR